MRCPKCNATTKVVDSRWQNNSMRRRRECNNCGHRFNTLEVRANDLYRIKLKLQDLQKDNKELAPSVNLVNQMVEYFNQFPEVFEESDLIKTRKKKNESS